MRNLIAALVLLVAAVSARAEAKYFMIMFAYQTEPNLARNSHTFATFIKKEKDDTQIETVSWLPEDGNIRTMKILNEKGKNYTLEETLRTAEKLKAKTYFIGPYEVNKEVYDKATAHIGRLKKGSVRYKALDLRGQRHFNCIHAVTEVVGSKPAIGFAWGLEASRRALNEFRPYIIDRNKRYTHLIGELNLVGQVSPAEPSWR